MEKDNPPPYQDVRMYPSSAPPQQYMAAPPQLQVRMESHNIPPRHHMAPPQPQPQVIIQPVVPFGPQPTRLKCPSCQADILTTVKTESSTKTHLIALLLCLVGGCFCSCIPYCVDSCMVQQHYCPNCKNYLGRYNN